MQQDTATITFHSRDLVSFNPSRMDDVEIRETENGYTFKVPVMMKSSGGGSIYETLQVFGIILNRPAVPLVNGKTQDFGYILQPGDEIIMLFQISGG
jgi:hypothetical protein